MMHGGVPVIAKRYVGKLDCRHLDHSSGTQFVAQKAAAQIKAIKNPAIESRWSAESRSNEAESAGEGCAPPR
jgi:hypothetical protein